MIIFLTINIAFSIILLSIAIHDFIGFKDKTLGEVGGWATASFAAKLLFGSFLVVITLITVAEESAKVTL